MLEIDSAIAARIVEDADMISIMGITASDDRVYAWYPQQDIVYTQGGSEVAIIFRSSNGGRSNNWSYPSQSPDIAYFFRILSISQLKSSQCAERLIALFDKTSLQTDNWNVKWIEQSGYSDGMMEGSPTHRIVSKNVTFVFKIVLSR